MQVSEKNGTFLSTTEIVVLLDRKDTKEIIISHKAIRMVKDGED